VARAGSSGYGGGKVAARVWGERRGRWRRDREEREALERQGRGVGKPLGYFFLNPNDYIASLFSLEETCILSNLTREVLIDMDSSRST
jgi:hypothetical protein